MKVLLIDDTRTEEAPNIMRKIDLIARTYWTGIDALTKMGPWDVLLLDHDLNSFVEGTNKEYTGYDVMCFLEANPEFLPKRIEVVSSNPVGRKRMQIVIDQLYKKEQT
jgi:hypothetical protein